MAAGATGGTSGSGGSGGSASGDLPTTCSEAAQAHGYVGCEFWPTVTPNLVWSIFDFAVLVANPGQTAASVTVTRNGAVSTSATVQPGKLATLYLPWDMTLKGADSDNCGSVTASGATLRVDHGAYRLTSTVPVAAYQFNALEYQPSGGPVNKDWSACPGTQTCASSFAAVGCFAYSNDASLLLPTTSLGTSYRVAGLGGWSAASVGPFLSVTATSDATNVTLQMPASTALVSGAGISAAAGGTATFSMNAGDVVELSAPPTGDFSGALVSADKAVQLVTGMSCVQAPIGTQACDHVEETVLPATALGKHYVVAVPTGPHGTPVAHVVRLYGHVDGTTLTYPSGMPAGAPTSLSAGQVADLGQVTQDFEIAGNQPFAVASILVGGALLDPGAASGSQEGDPSLSFVAPSEQYRKTYVLASANNYDSSYLDVVALNQASLTLDGNPVTATPTAIGASGTEVYRIQLDATSGAHTLVADQPVGLSVTGYGLYTSYAYPAGMDVRPLP